MKTIEEVKTNEKKSGTKNGKPWSFTPVSIRIEGKWYSQNIFKDQELESLKEGLEVDLIFYDEKYNGNIYHKFKFATETDRLKIRVDHLEQGLKKLYDNVNIKAFLDAEEL